ncbi:MAG: hypothetical protein D6715_06965 [Calditrichaeota bacterium]|nr:MAG: hypothetical protein D6715_06965 [Calditrichota bacterium]
MAFSQSDAYPLKMNPVQIFEGVCRLNLLGRPDRHKNMRETRRPLVAFTGRLRKFACSNFNLIGRI